MTSSVLALRGISSVGCSAMHRTTAPLSVLETGSVSLDTEIQVRASLLPLLFSWLWPVSISWSPANHRAFDGGLPPWTTHSSSMSSPAEAVVLLEPSDMESPTRWIKTDVGLSENNKCFVTCGIDKHYKTKCFAFSLSLATFLSKKHFPKPPINSAGHSTITYR